MFTKTASETKRGSPLELSGWPLWRTEKTEAPHLGRHNSHLKQLPLAGLWGGGAEGACVCVCVCVCV